VQYIIFGVLLGARARHRKPLDDDVGFVETTKRKRKKDEDVLQNIVFFFFFFSPPQHKDRYLIRSWTTFLPRRVLVKLPINRNNLWNVVERSYTEYQ
jgi:hypothetical protein